MGGVGWHFRRMGMLKAEEHQTLHRYSQDGCLPKPYKAEVLLLILTSAVYIGARTVAPYVGKMIIDEGVVETRVG